MSMKSTASHGYISLALLLIIQSKCHGAQTGQKEQWEPVYQAEESNKPADGAKLSDRMLYKSITDLLNNRQRKSDPDSVYTYSPQPWQDIGGPQLEGAEDISRQEYEPAMSELGDDYPGYAGEKPQSTWTVSKGEGWTDDAPPNGEDMDWWWPNMNDDSEAGESRPVDEQQARALDGLAALMNTVEDRLNNAADRMDKAADDAASDGTQINM